MLSLNFSNKRPFAKNTAILEAQALASTLVNNTYLGENLYVCLGGSDSAAERYSELQDCFAS